MDVVKVTLRLNIPLTLDHLITYKTYAISQLWSNVDEGGYVSPGITYMVQGAKGYSETSFPQEQLFVEERRPKNLSNT